MAVFCEHINEFSSTTEGGEYFDQLISTLK